MRYEILFNYLCMSILIIFVCQFFCLQECIAHDQHREMEEWMVICQRNADHHTIVDCDGDHDWSTSNTVYTNIDDLPTFITRHRQATQQHRFTTTADPSKL